MLKKENFIFILCLFLGGNAAWGQPVQPAAVAGLVTVNGVKVEQASDPGYIFVITRPDGSNFVSDTGAIAEDADGLNSSDAYQINIPLYDASEQPLGAKTGEAAVIHIRLNSKDLTITSPSGGEITIGAVGSTTRYDLVAGDASENNPPSANAGSDQQVTGNTLVTLNGSQSSDPDAGDVITYQWQQTQGETVVLSNAASSTPSFTAPDPAAAQQEVLVFVLTVTDSQNQTDSDSVSITVTSSRKIAPVANAGPSQTVQEGALVTLDGSNSTDPDSEGSNGIETFNWFQTSGPTVTLSTVVNGQTTFTAPEVGTQGESLEFELTVTDKDGLQDTDSTIVNVVSVNNPPVADAGSNQNVQAGDTVTLNGSASTDPDAGDRNQLAFQWVQTAGTTVSLSNFQIASPVFTAPAVGDSGESLKFELRVTDPGGLVSTDNVTVNVVSANQPPVSDAGTDQNTAAGQLVTLNGSNSRDPEGQSLIYLWGQLGGSPVSLSNAKSAITQFTAPDTAPQTLTFKLTVIDAEGLEDSDRTQVHVIDSGIPPTADAGANQSVTTGMTVMLDGSQSNDQDGSISKYLWAQVSGDAWVTLSNSASPTPTFIAPSVGSQGDTLRFKLTVTDNDGLTNEDETLVSVAPLSGNVKPPVANTSGSSEEVNEGTSGILDGTQSVAPSGQITSYRWKQISGPSVTIHDPDADMTTFNAPGVDGDAILLQFRLTVTDSNGLSDDAELLVSIKGLGPGPGETNGSCFVRSLMDG